MLNFTLWLSLPEKEEHGFLKEICFAALSADKKEVKFAAVLDENGKLFAAEYNKRQFFKNTNNTMMIKSSIFYLHYLILVLRQHKVRNDCASREITKDNNMSYLKLQDLGDNIYLVVTQLTEKKDRYLCMYLECYPSSKIMTYGQIISKISNTF